MRRNALSVVRQTTSSRQSPNRSPLSAGVDLVPLLDVTPDAVSRRVSADVPYLSMWLLSSSSRTVSESHQTRKLAEPGVRPIDWQDSLKRFVIPGPEPQYSAPA